MSVNKQLITQYKDDRVNLLESEDLEPRVLPRRKASWSVLRPILGVGGSDASMKGIDSSS